MSTTGTTTTKPQTTYNGWANKATWLVNVYLYEYLYDVASLWISTHRDTDNMDATDVQELIWIVKDYTDSTVREVLYDAVEQIDNGRDSMLRAMVCDFVSMSVHDVDTYTLATHIVEQYLEECE